MSAPASSAFVAAVARAECGPNRSTETPTFFSYCLMIR